MYFSPLPFCYMTLGRVGGGAISPVLLPLAREEKQKHLTMDSANYDPAKHSSSSNAVAVRRFSPTFSFNPLKPFFEGDPFLEQYCKLSDRPFYLPNTRMLDFFLCVPILILLSNFVPTTDDTISEDCFCPIGTSTQRPSQKSWLFPSIYLGRFLRRYMPERFSLTTLRSTWDLIMLC
jgi:hypothetical protein